MARRALGGPVPTPVKWGGNRGPVSRLLLRAGPYLAPGTTIKSIYFGPLLRWDPFLPSAQGAAGSSRVWAHERVNDLVCAGAHASAPLPGLCAPPKGRPPQAAAAAKWPCAALRVPRVWPPSPAAEITGCAPRAGWRTASKARGPWLPVPSPAQPSPPGIFCLLRPPSPPAKSAPGQGPRAAPPRQASEGGRAAPTPAPRRPDGFFHDCIRPRAAFVPVVPGGSPPLPRAPGFFQGSIGAWQSSLPAPGLQNPGSGGALLRNLRSPAGSRALSRLPLGPSGPRRQDLRPLSPTFVRKVDGL